MIDEGSSTLRQRRLGFYMPLAMFAALFVLGVSPLGGLLNYGFTPLIVLLGGAMLLFTPRHYIGFVMWVWMLAPLYRRLADLHAGYNSTSVVLLAPLIVTLLSVVAIIRDRKWAQTADVTPYWVLVVLIIYGFFVGALSAGFLAAALALANWVVPVIFAIHVLTVPLSPAEKARVMLLALVWGGLVLGLYGLVQYLVLPAWDAAWMRDSQLESIGAPFPRMVRVFGTLNHPGTYAQYVGAAVLAALATRSSLRGPALVAAAIGTLLSLVRAMWGAMAIGLLIYLMLANAKQKANLIMALAGMTVVTVALIAVTPLGDTVIRRVDTLSSTTSDASYLERADLYNRFSSTIFSSIMGVGLGQTGVVSTHLSGQDPNAVDAVTVIDSGLLEILFTFGIAGLVFLIAIGSLLMQAWPSRFNPFGVAAIVVAMTCPPLLFFGNPLVAATGMMFYPFAALARLNRWPLEPHIAGA